MGVKDPQEMSDTEQGDIGLETQHINRIQVMRIHRIHNLLEVHRRARAQSRIRLTKGAR